MESINAAAAQLGSKAELVRAINAFCEREGIRQRVTSQIMNNWVRSGKVPAWACPVLFRISGIRCAEFNSDVRWDLV
jgi:hypothetical protein